MNRNPFLSRIEAARVSAILRTPDTDRAARAMEAAVRGGFRMIEFTLSIPGALELVSEFSKREDLLVGTGTVLNPAQAEASVGAGARFLVSPVADPDVSAAARSLDVPSIPGTFTPGEMLAAQRAGADLLKIFPAPADLPRFVTQVLGPFPDFRLFPTAGVTPENFREVLGAGAFGVGFVASLFTPADLASGNDEAIERRAGAILARLTAPA